MSEDGENRMIGGKPVRRVSFDTRGIFAPGQFTPESQTPPPEPPENLDQQMWNTGGALPGEARVQPQGMTAEQQAGVQVGNSIVREPTTAESQSQLKTEISEARKKMANRILRWKALPEEQRVEHVGRFIDAFKNLAQRKAGELNEESGGFLQKMAARIAEIIDEDVIPGVEPFTKGVLILAFTDMALPPSLSVPLTKLIGDHLAGRIEKNFRNGSSQLKKLFGVIDANAQTPEDKGFVARLRARFGAMHPDAEIPPPPDGAEVALPAEPAEESESAPSAEAETATPAESAEPAEAEDTPPPVDEPESDEASEQVELSDDVIDAYMKYLSYGQTQRDRAEADLRTHPMAVEYSKEIIRMRDEYGEDILFEAADYAVQALKNGLAPLHIEPSDAGKSRSWFLWHAAKLRFLKNNPDVQALMPNAGRYHPEDPLRAVDDTLPEDEAEKSQEAFREIILVMLGYEIYRHAQGNQELIKSLADSGQDDAQKAEIKLLLSENVAPGASLSSYKLRRLGQLMIGMEDEGTSLLSEEDDEGEEDISTPEAGGPADEGGIIRPPRGPRGPESLRSPEEESKPTNGYMMERADIMRQYHEISQQLTYQIQTRQLRKPGGGNFSTDEVNDLIFAELRQELKGKPIYTLHRPNGTIYYTEYLVTDYSDCKAFGEGSKSIVVILNLAGLLSNFTPDEVEIIRSFDERYLGDDGMPELFEVYMNRLVSNAREGARDSVTGSIDTIQMRQRINKGYQDYKDTLMSLMYTLISSKVAGEEQQDVPSLRMAETIKKRLSELKSATKYPSFSAVEDNPEGFRVRTKGYAAVPSDANMRVPATRRYGGRTQFVEVETELTISDAIKKDLIPTLEGIEASVAYANSIRAKTYSAGSLKDLIDTASKGINIESIPTTIKYNRYLQFAMQEYIRAQAQVNAQVNHIPNSNFGGLVGSDKLEEAEIMTVDALNIRFPFEPKSQEEIDQEIDKRLRESREAYARDVKLKIRIDEFDEQSELRRIKHEVALDEKRRKARISMDIELAARMASGLHKGLGEYWAVMDAMVGEEVLTSYGDDDAPVRDFADFKSPLMPKLMEMAPVEAMRFGQGAGFSAMALPSERYFGQRPRKTGTRLRSFIRSTSKLFDRPTAPHIRLADMADKADAQTPAQVHDIARAIAEAERKGCPPELLNWYRKYITMGQQMRKVPGDLPRSGGWRVDGDDSFDRKFATAFTKEATDQSLTGIALHRYVIEQMRALGGERMVMHYISKKVEAICSDENPQSEIALVSARYKALKSKVEANYKSGRLDPELESEAEATKIELDVLKDAAKIDLLDRYVFSPLLKKSPEMALLIERRGLTPVGELTVRQRLLNKIESDYRIASEYSYALMYQCMPALEVATRQWNNRTRSPDPDTQAQIDEKTRLQISGFFRDKIEGSGVDSSPSSPKTPGIPVTQLKSLRDMLPGSIDQKVALMRQMYATYWTELNAYTANNDPALRKDGQSLSRRFAEQVVLGIGNADALMTSGAGFDYSRVQFTGANALASSLGGVNTNIEMKSERNALFGEDGVLATAYKSTDTDLREPKNLIDFAKKISDPLMKIAKAQSKNPDEVKVIYTRLAQMCVFSFKPSQSSATPEQLASGGDAYRHRQNRNPGIWSVGDNPHVGLELDDQQRYQLMRVLLVQGGIPERRFFIDAKQMDPLTPVQIELQRQIASASDDRPVVLDLNLGDPVRLKSRREELSAKLVRTGKVTEAAVSQGQVLKDMIYGSSRISVPVKPS